MRRSFKTISVFSCDKEINIDLFNIEGLDPREVIKIEIISCFGGIRIELLSTQRKRPKVIWKRISNVSDIGVGFSNGDYSTTVDLYNQSKCVFFRHWD